jgi:MFS family permease
VPPFEALNGLSGDGRVLFLTRSVRLFAYGLLSVGLVLYLREIGLSGATVGLLLLLTLVGDTAVSLAMTSAADIWGRRRTLQAGALLMIFAAVLLGATSNVWLLALGVTIGVLSPSGGEVGPFLSVEQAALSQTTSSRLRTVVFAWHNLTGAFSTATGALVAGFVAQRLVDSGWEAASAYRPLIAGYAVLGCVLFCCFLRLSAAVEAPQASAEKSRGVLRRPRPEVLGLTALFTLDSFASGFVLQSLLAYWFSVRFGTQPDVLGRLFFGTSLLGGISGLLAAQLSQRIGLINTMVFTHLPANALLIALAFAPTEGWAFAILLARHCIASMDVPARQSYTMAIVPPEERAAAAGVTGVARTIGSALAAPLAAVMMGSPDWGPAPLLLAGGLKIVYDVLLYRGFASLRPAEREAAEIPKGR